MRSGRKENFDRIKLELQCSYLKIFLLNGDCIAQTRQALGRRMLQIMCDHQNDAIHKIERHQTITKPQHKLSDNGYQKQQKIPQITKLTMVTRIEKSSQLLARITAFFCVRTFTQLCT